MKSKKTEEEKVVEILAKLLDNHWFNPRVFANLIVNEYPLYTQDKLTELLVEIVKYQRQRYNTEVEHGTTSAGLAFSDLIGDVIAGWEGTHGR